MKTHTPPPITGYRALPQDDVDLINRIKAHEIETAALWAQVRATLLTHRWSTPQLGESLRQCALARTSFEGGFMHLVRAVAFPAPLWGGMEAESSEQASIAREALATAPTPKSKPADSSPGAESS